MKKLICILLSLLICIGLCGCNILNFEDTESTPNPQPTEAETNSDTEVETEGTAESETEITTEIKVQTETEETTEATSEESSEIINVCEHNWERVENLNEYTATDKCSICGETRIYTDSENIPNSNIATGFKILTYQSHNWYVSKKEIKDCDLGYAIIDCLLNLKETGDISPHISDDLVKEFSSEELPVEGGTIWIECEGVGIFRISSYLKEICKVETHLGEGKVLEMTDTLKELLKQAINYHPYDYWQGEYENDNFNLKQIYKADSAVEWVRIDSIHIENVHHSDDNKITLRIKANETKTAYLNALTYQSDDSLGSTESRQVDLIAGEETVVELTFHGFYNAGYYLEVVIDKTKVSLLIDPRLYTIFSRDLTCFTAEQPSWSSPDLEISAQQANSIIGIWNRNVWENGVTETEYDFVFRGENLEIRYSYDKGIFNDIINNKHVILSEQMRLQVNEIIDEFVVLPIVD